MKTQRERVKARLQKNRTLSTISIRMPDDALDDLKEIARPWASRGTSRSCAPASARVCTRT